MSAQSGVPQARAHSLTVVTLNLTADESHSAHKDLTNAHGVPRKQRTTSRERGRTPESLILATQRARGLEWLQARGHGIPIMTGDPTQTHTQHKNAGANRTYPCIPNPTSTCGSRVSLESNAR